MAKCHISYIKSPCSLEYYDYICHFISKYGDKLLLWASHVKEAQAMCRRVPAMFRLEIFDTVTEEWSCNKCTGPHPRRYKSHEIVGDKLYFFEWSDPISVLDLRTLTWTRLSMPESFPEDFRLLSSAAYQDSIYFYGENMDSSYGPLWKTLFVAFNTRTRKWKWPKCSGPEPPEVRGSGRSIVCGDYMLYCAAGHIDKSRMQHDIHALHLPSFKWTTHLPGPVEESFKPKFKQRFTLNTAGTHKALLLETVEGYGSKECFWLLKWSIGDSGIEDIQWSRLEENERPISGAVINKYYMRNLEYRYGEPPFSISILAANPLSLLEASFRVVEQNRLKYGAKTCPFPSELEKMVRQKISFQ